MATSLEKLKKGKIDKINMIDVKVVKKINEEDYIVADETEHTLLGSPQKLKEGCSYKLIKPSFADSQLIKKTKFAAVKIEREIKTKVLKKEDEKKLVEKINLENGKEEPKNVNDFVAVNELGVGAMVGEIILMVVNKSSVIEGTYGTYRIITCKDMNNRKNSINLYRNMQDLVEVGEVYVFTSLKVNNFKKEDQDFNRLGTVHATRITSANMKMKQEFKAAGIMLGDHQIKGNIIGISEVNVYESCVKCWSKVEENNFCKKCKKMQECKKKVFNLIMYIQNENDEAEILDVFVFKTTLGLVELDEVEISEDSLNAKLIEKKCLAEYIIDKNRDDEKFRLVKFTMS